MALKPCCNVRNLLIGERRLSFAVGPTDVGIWVDLGDATIDGA